MISDKPGTAESTREKIGRELNLAGEGIGGFGDAAYDAFSNHRSETLAEAGGSVAVGIGLAAVRRLPEIGAPVAVAISAGFFCAGIKTVAQTGFEALSAFSDSWTSAGNWQTNKTIVRSDLGRFAFDSALLAGASGLSAGLMRGFGPPAFHPAAFSPVGETSHNPSFEQTTHPLLPSGEISTKRQPVASGRSEVTSLAFDSGAPGPRHSNESSRVPVRETYKRNQQAGKSHWMMESPTASLYPSVKGIVDVDIAIVGGGIGSIMAASLASRGYKVALVDAGRIAGENATLSGMAGIGTRAFDEASSTMVTELGFDNTKRVVDIAKSGQRWLRQRAERVGAFRPVTSYAVSPDLADLQNEAQLVTRLDNDAHFLSADRIKASIPNAAGAIALEKEGLINPVALAVRSLAREQLRPGSGLRVFEHSPVLSIGVDSRAHLELPEGRINADRVLVMTGLPSKELTGVDVPLIRKQVYAVSADIGKGSPPPGPVFDDGTFTFYAPLGGKKLLFGGAGTKLSEVTAFDSPITKVAPLLQSYYPGATIEHAWQRQIAAAPDRRGIIDFAPAHGSKVVVASAFGGTGYLFTGVTRQMIEPMLAGYPHPFPAAFGLDRPALL